MIKFLFLSPGELEKAISKIIKKEQGKNATCRVDYSETLQTDVINIQTSSEREEVPVKDFLKALSEQFNVDIKSYDVFEVGDYGEGFAFFIA